MKRRIKEPYLILGFTLIEYDGDCIDIELEQPVMTVEPMSVHIDRFCKQYSNKKCLYTNGRLRIKQCFTNRSVQ